MWPKFKRSLPARPDASALAMPIGGLAIAMVAAASGWYARGALEADNASDASMPSPILRQLLEPTTCPPRVIGKLVTVGCGNETLAESGKLNGSVDVISSMPGRMTISGWAADGAKPVKLVLIAVDGKVKFWAKPQARREDVAKYFKKPSLAMSGFDVTVAVPDDFRRADHDIRVFGVAKDGSAKELGLGPNAVASR
jgi:hypothetical protein